MIEKQHVLVAMSGGVDSSVAATLLLKQGFKVTGIMLNLWSDPKCELQNACCTPEAQRIAKTTADQLNIPFYVIDAKSKFFNEVVQYFLKSHQMGITPNPCWVCNVNVKWSALIEQMKYFDAVSIVTGHYAIVKKDEKNLYHLYQAKDHSKDQSYVLSGLTQSQLAYTLFPLGNLTKNQVREKAKTLGLNTADRPDSQDLCFLGGKTSEQFISEFNTEQELGGDIIDTSGRVLGQHTGLSNYTIGQRKGIKIFDAEPYYVIGKRISSNQLIIGKRFELGGKEFSVSHANWISGKKPRFPISVHLQIRYRAVKVDAILESDENDQLEVKSDIVLRDITPGQIAVFYDRNEVMGSGIIIDKASFK